MSGLIAIGAGLAISATVTATVAADAHAQGQPEEPAPGDRMNVYMDCEGRRCNPVETFFRTEITWVNWVRDREDSDVHVILTEQATGSGGTEFQLDYIGRGALTGSDDQLFFRSLGTDVEQEAFDGLTTNLAIGLARYAALLGLRDLVVFEPLEVAGLDPDARVLAPQEVDDMWNLWVFDVRASGTLDGTDTRDTERITLGLTASRTTPTWKTVLDFSGNRNVIKTELNDGSIFESTLTDWSGNVRLVYSMADHWSVGVISSTGKLPRVNQDFRVEVRPALEYSVFPYAEATRKTLTAGYSIGPAYRNYREATIFGQTEETRFEQALQLRFSIRQPWGDGSATVTASHFLHDVKKHNVSLRGSISFRVARGLSLNTGANVSWVTDQIYLSADGETDEEILLNLRTRASDFNYGMNVGFSFRFGSIFNNVVNNRFPGIGPGG